MSHAGKQQQLLESPIAARTVPAGADVEDIYGMAQPIVVSDPLLEYRAIREGAAILDFSPLHKIDVEGPDAKRKMNALFTRDIERIPTGRIAYGAILGEDGTMRDDSTVAVRGDDRLRVVGSPLMPAEVIAFAEAQGLTAVERRPDLAHINLQGPGSREIFAQLTGEDVSNEAFPYYAFKDSITVAGVDDVFVTRMGYTAELGYEFFVPVDSALAFYDALSDAGSAFGIRPVGVVAILTVRLEAGMVMGEFEYDTTTSPWECALGWAVDLDKGDFRGREATLALRETRTARVVTVVLDGGEDAAIGAVLTTAEGEQIGVVTMSMPSPLLGGQTIGMAKVHKDHTTPGTRVVALVGDEQIAGKVVATPVYDPERKRVKS